MAIWTETVNGKGTVRRLGGAITAAVSLAAGLLFLSRPMACSFVTSFQLVIWGALFLVGVLAFIIGSALSRK